MKIYIDGRRDGYTTGQCGKTMTLAELLNHLYEIGTDYGAVEFDEDEYEFKDVEDTKVYIINDNGYTYGSVTSWSVYVPEDDDEDDEDEEDEE